MTPPFVLIVSPDTLSHGTPFSFARDLAPAVVTDMCGYLLPASPSPPLVLHCAQGPGLRCSVSTCRPDQSYVKDAFARLPIPLGSVHCSPVPNEWPQSTWLHSSATKTYQSHISVFCKVTLHLIT